MTLKINPNISLQDRVNRLRIIGYLKYKNIPYDEETTDDKETLEVNNNSYSLDSLTVEELEDYVG